MAYYKNLTECPPVTDLGEALYFLRLDRRLTREALAKATGLTAYDIARIETPNSEISLKDSVSLLRFFSQDTTAPDCGNAINAKTRVLQRLGKTLAHLRVDEGITQRALAKKSHNSATNINFIETGKLYTFSTLLKTLQKLGYTDLESVLAMEDQFADLPKPAVPREPANTLSFNRQAFGDALKKHIATRGLSQKSYSKQTGINEHAICDIIAGEEVSDIYIERVLNEHRLSIQQFIDSAKDLFTYTPEERKQLGHKIKTLRAHYGLSQDDVCELAGISDKLMTNIEAGATSSRAALILKIIQCFGADSPTDFMTAPLEELRPIETVLERKEHSEASQAKQTADKPPADKIKSTHNAPLAGYLSVVKTALNGFMKLEKLNPRTCAERYSLPALTLTKALHGKVDDITPKEEDYLRNQLAQDLYYDSFEEFRQDVSTRMRKLATQTPQKPLNSNQR